MTTGRIIARKRRELHMTQEQRMNQQVRVIGGPSGAQEEA